MHLPFSKYGLIILLAILTFGLSTWDNTNKPELTITERKVLSGVASASGIAIFNDSLYVIGDDVPWFYQLNEASTVQSKISFGNYPLGPDSVIAKPEKPDLEALATTENTLLALGSGSLSPQRDIMVRLADRNQPQIYSLQSFYNRLRSLPEFKRTQLNIEGFAITNDYLFLLNRENNLVLRFFLSDFLAYIKAEESFPKPEIYKIILPKIKGIEAGLSGADIIPGTSKIIFTASVEDTPNPIDDGEVLGSFVGIIDIKEIENQYRPGYAAVMENNKQLPIKLESVSILNHTPENTEIVLVTDSDGGNSEILRADFKWN
ncbi:MAG: hypothetical protein JXR26_08190 [Balneolaceae bacterium]|nr:hypothetical protein [Balneolaceae bacterium]